ncbi:hypothetical protein SISNIDRAFT_162747 [Sistotremastrum niveocremeum HHB9708]|uniref:2-dehydropantoate 2-reductase n=1 Tax=Sistotremastrum niveocremeum HHB9708 TaxID=1314777 RepID=A0A164SN45_9AGAM|nr:hypothetical protein SISNIDRAFT_162747 [Sistotremastrum niveocremeum HHB9708]
MRFHVVGLGSVGSLFAFHLRRTLSEDHPISIIIRNRKRFLQPPNASTPLFVEKSSEVSNVRGFEWDEMDALENRISNLVFDESGGVRNMFARVDDGFEHRRFNRYREEQMQKNRNSTTSLSSTSRSSTLSGGRFRDNSTKIESLFVATKAFQVIPVLQQLRPRMSSSTTIVLLQNGMGIYEKVINELFRNPDERPHFVLASNTHGAWLRKPLHTVHAGDGDLRFGIVPDPQGRDFEASTRSAEAGVRTRALSLDDIAPPAFPTRPSALPTSTLQSNASSPPSLTSPDTRYASLRATIRLLLSLSELNPVWETAENMQTRLRQKLVVNSVINPLTALMGCRNGDLFLWPSAHRIAKAVCNEASDVFKAQTLRHSNVNLSDSTTRHRYANIELDEVNILLPRELRSRELHLRCRKVSKQTADNFSSMLVDMRKGGQTEIDFMNGYLHRAGLEYGVRTPTIDALLWMVKLKKSMPNVAIDYYPHLKN